jgi:MinD-like ATPase involved in chromosome partitioning or flagellar assembly
MLVAFWGPSLGQGRTSSNMAAIATTIALDHHVRILVTHTHQGHGTLEHIFASARPYTPSLHNHGGMDAIERLVMCGMLTPEGIRDQAESILKDRLELLRGLSGTGDKAQKLILPHIFREYQRFYDLLFIDMSSESNSDVVNMVLQQADLVVVNINQDRRLLESYFHKGGKAVIGDHAPMLYCLGAYERTSRLNKEKIIKQFGLNKKELGVIPYDVRFLDAQNEQRMLQFLLKAREAKARFLDFNEEQYFTEAVRHMAKLILQRLELSPISEMDDDND